jgi:cation transport ATPase
VRHATIVIAVVSVAFAVAFVPIGIFAGLTLREAGIFAIERGFRLLGICGLADTLRSAVPAAVADCHRAGIRVVMITGDHGLTARAIARQAGIITGDARIVTGDEVDALPEVELQHMLAAGTELVFARSSPETKLKIARAFRELHLTVAMTGDGVNAAPELRQADIGVWSNPLLLVGSGFELVVAAVVVTVPPVQSLFNTTAVTWGNLLLVAPFSIIVWGADELQRSRRLRRSAA